MHPKEVNFWLLYVWLAFNQNLAFPVHGKGNKGRKKSKVRQKIHHIEKVCHHDKHP